ncbi:gliding motility-associated C-terminal domain-containing protein [Flavobacterium sp.]|uniref:gliding motility-associated C-terminal domain-containing protein n=1 Tax=Flavobacterium sp. TaxID=239 RepID=UPI00286F4273|nr:gliding motility-associated C-terminal domain-containing protein [Flavobacterium sp.]
MKPTFTRLGRLFVFVFFHCSLVLSAQIGPGIAPVSSPSGGFNINGTLSSNSAIGDWVFGTGSGGFVLANSGTPLNIKTTYHLYDEYNSSTDNIFGGGDKVSDNPNSMSWTLGTANNKTDMNNALIHFTTDANGNVWFVFAADRLSNSGNAYIDFEFLQDELTKTATGFASTGSSVTGGRTQGDFLLTVYFENGAANFDIQHWENVSGTWQYKTYFSSLPLNSVYAAGNSTTVPVPYSAFGTNSYPQNTFIESVVNLTEVLGAIDPCANLKIKTIFVKSKTSTAPSASIKDFFEPLAVTNLTLGSADAGDDDTICSGGNYKLQGVAVPSSNYAVVSTTWSVLSGSVTIASPTTLDSYVTINGSSATLRLTVETHPSNGIGTHCIVYDDVTITTTPSPSCSITGSNGPLCPSTIANNYAAPVSSSYSWSISGNGTLSGSTTSQTVSVTAGQNCNASFTLTLNTTDTNGCTSECTKTVAVNNTTSPIITTTSGTLNHTLQCNNTSGITAALEEVPTATDNCSATPTIHLVSDVTTPTTDCANGYSRVRTWNFTDDCGNTSANFVQTITVIDDVAPVVTTTSGTLNHTLQCNNASGIASALMEVPTATDNCSTTPTMHLVSDVTTPDANCANGYSRVRTWNFTDGCGNTSANFVQTITVIDDVAPVVTTTSGSLNHTLQCNNASGIESALMEVPTATDNCSATPTIHLVSDVTTPTTDCANGYSRVRTWNFTDGCGNTSDNFVQTITVIDDVVPVVSTISGTLNHTLQCNNASGIESALMEVPTANDNCSATPTMHLVSDVTTPTTDCANGYSRVRTWNFTDDCGNTSANFMQTINVIDDIAPVVSTISGTLNHTLQCNNASGIASALMEVPTATDNCSATPTIHLVSDVTTPTTDCANGYSRVRTWNFTDGCGNTSANFVQTITVIDDVAPVVTTISGALNHTLQCNNASGIESALMEVPTANDNCSATPTMHLVSDVTTPTTDCANGYSRVRTWNFTDGCGNTSTNFVQTITVIDDVAPIVSTISGTLNHTLQCNNTSGIASALMEVPTATDNCSATPTMHLVSDVTTPTTDCANGYSRVRTWNFTDGCGNTSANFVQEIIVQDTIAPTFVETVPNNTTVECNTIPIPVTLTAIDNCSEAIVVFSESELPGSCPGSYTINRTWTATDSCGNQNSHTQIITVKDTTAPTFIAPVDITLTSDSNCYADISTTSTGVVTNIKDNCDPNPITSYEDSDCFGNFNSASVNSGNGNYFPFTVSGFDSITANNIKKVALAFETNQGKGRAEFVLVAPNGQGIVLVAPYCKGGDCDNLTSSEKELYLPVFYPNSSNYPKWDNSNPIVTNSIQNFTPNGVLSTTNTITGLSSLISSFEEFTGDLNGNWFVFARKDGTEEGRIEFKSICLTPSTNLCGSNTVIVRKWSVSDACSNTVTFNQIIKIVDTTAPTWITEVGSLNTSIECSDEKALGNAQNLFPIASDNCDKNLSNIVKVAGEFVASSTCATTGTYTNTWTVTDSCGNTSANYVQTITVIDNIAPVVTTTSGTLNHTLQCDDASGIESALMEVPTATDNCSATTTMHLVSDVTIPTTDCANGYSRVRTWNFTDGCGNTSADFVQTITVIDDIAPVVTTTSGTLNHTLQCDNASGIASALMEIPTATDNCSTTPTMHLVSDVTTPTTDCANGYSRVRTWNFNDGCGNTSANFVQTITVIDDVAPIVSTTSGTLNHTLQCNNASGIASALMEVPTATDNCSATPTMHLVSDVTTPTTDCANGYSRARTWNFTDDCGNTSANFVQTITVIDDVAPVVTTTSGTLNHTLQCNNTSGIESALAEIPTATDNCSATPTMHLVSDVTTPTTDCANGYSRVRTWNFTDSCGNTSANYVQTITVIDNIAPVVSTISGTLNHTLQCDNASGIASALMEVPTATDNCSATPTIHLVSDVTTPTTNCANGYSRVRIWNFTDGCGNTSANFVQTITIIDDIAPVVTTTSGTLNHTLQCNNASGIADALMEVPTATDNCSATPTIHLVSDVTTPTTDCANGYSRVRTWNFTDDCGNTSADYVQTITVIDNIAPVVTTTSGTLNHTLQCNNASGIESALAEIPTATDNCSATPTMHLVSDITTPTTDCTNGYSRVRTWNFTDGCGNTSADFVQEIIVQDTIAPIWITQVGSLNTTIECNDAQALANAQNSFPIASDNCDTTLNNIKKTAGEFVASSTCANSGTYTNTWTVTDDCGNNSETFTQVITIQDSESPKMITKATDIVVECDGQGNQNAITNWLATNGGAIASDNCSEIIWTNNFNSIANDCSAAVTVVFTATDACGNSTSTSGTFSVQDNTPPTVPDSPASITVGCAAEIPEMISLTANDNCSGNITVEGINTIELGDCDATYTIKRTWTFRDACNNISTVSQTINVVDTTAPTIAQLPEPSTISCPNTPIFAQATATDECGLNFSLTFKDVKTEGNCAGSYSITRTWTAADSCGNSTTASQTITVQDTAGPVFSSLPEPTTISCPNTPVFAFATATDECGSDFSLTFNDVKTEGNCAGSYSITRTWTATDTCGNSSTASQTITIEDTTGPTTTTEFSTTITGNCDAIPAKPELVFVDACSTVLPASFSETISNLTADSYVINRKWIVSDSCGNASEFVQTINVTITNSLTSLSGTICNDGETTSIDLTSLFPVGTPTNGTWTDVSNTGKLVGNTFNAASLSVGDYLFEYMINDTNCPRTIRITISVTTGCGGIVLPCGTIVIHNAFSPNGDGINEKFVIDNINDTNCYPDNTVEIYNRWGVLVYSTKGYNNTTNAFDGISDGRSTVSQSSGLPAGTYFYILTYTSFDNNNVIQTNKKEGYLFLTK